MLRFLFGSRKTPEVKIETQRESFTRLVEDLNAAIDALPDKPRVTVDPATGHILPEAPEHFPDEALALPAPALEAAQKEAVKAAMAADGGVSPTKPEAVAAAEAPVAEASTPAAASSPEAPRPQ